MWHSENTRHEWDLKTVNDVLEMILQLLMPDNLDKTL